jgi:DNA-binding SARP family transcriptional activator
MGVSALAVRIRLLGQVMAWSGATQIPIGSARQRAILAYLALHPAQAVPIKAMTEAVWGDTISTGGEQVARSHVARLRQLLEPATAPRSRTNIIASVPGGYRLQVAPAAVDAFRFRELHARARELEAAGAAQDAFDRLGQAIALWEDPALSDLSGLLTGSRHIATLRAEWIDAGLRFVGLGLVLDRAAAVLPVAEQMAVHEPLEEAVQARYLQALARTGQRAVAVRYYLTVRGRLRADLGVEPGAELRRVHSALLNADTEAGVDRRAAPPEPRAERKSFWWGEHPSAGPLFGRAGDLARCAALLVAHRQVTVTGPSGCGKSALALALAEHVSGAFTEGVAIVDATEAGTCEDLLRLLAATLGLPAGADPLRAVGDRHILLGLDDVDHLGGGATRAVLRVLGSCPGAAMLVTSRHRLGLEQEAVYRLGPLPFPDVDDPLSAQHNPAVELFVDRARLVEASFRLTPENTGTIARICRRLDCLPLAIELAAACLYADDLDGILGRTGDPAQQLLPRRRGRPRHHRSLSASLARSVDALSDVERSCLSRIAGERTRFSQAEAAEWCSDVVAGGRFPDVLHRLVEESLVQSYLTADGSRRFEILRTVASSVTALA